jgi:hypothetical protein
VFPIVFSSQTTLMHFVQKKKCFALPSGS